MNVSPAPFYNDVALGPEDVAAFWLTTEDGLRIRVAVWGTGQTAAKGVILMFPGRTEFVEKYGKTAADFLAEGYFVVAIDWRGQGLADRMLPNRAFGHVDDFKDYQADLRAVMAAWSALGLPEGAPRYMIGHSMGGCIGLRSLMDGLDVKAAAFSAPMWGIAMGRPKRTAAWVVSSAARRVGLDKGLAPGTIPTTYVLAQPYEDNMLTTDREMFDYMHQQVVSYPDLALGGPSLAWLNEGLIECRSLRARPTPNTPCLTFLGTNERIVDVLAIHDRMARWSNGTLEMLQGAEHEVLMEAAPVRAEVTSKILAHFTTHS